jgi:hypothetical protein
MAMLAGAIAIDITTPDATPSPPWTATGLAKGIFEADALPYFAKLGNTTHSLTGEEKTQAYLAAAGFKLDVTLTDEQKAAAEVEAIGRKVERMKETLTYFAVRAQAIATAIVSHVATSADVRIPANAIDPGVPSVERVITGAVE